jgi:hypothetical protein
MIFGAIGFLAVYKQKEHTLEPSLEPSFEKEITFERNRKAEKSYLRPPGPPLTSTSPAIISFDSLGTFLEPHRPNECCLLLTPNWNVEATIDPNKVDDPATERRPNKNSLTNMEYLR